MAFKAQQILRTTRPLYTERGDTVAKNTRVRVLATNENGVVKVVLPGGGYVVAGDPAFKESPRGRPIKIDIMGPRPESPESD